MKSTRICERCGTVVPANAPDNLCLSCLLDTAVDLDDTEAGGIPISTPGDPSLGSADQHTPRPVFGDYDLLGELGRGGQGVVYRARHRGLGRLVALKTIPPVHLAGAHARERFRLEATTASHLDHPNIVPIYEVGECDGFNFYSMKLVEGATIQQLVSRGVPDAAACRHNAAVLLKVARAVHHAHQRGVLHRDLKPSNVLLDQDDEPHVSDFGLARQTHDDSSLTLSQAMLGTPAYAAPEVALGGARHATVAADIYGLGAILYQLLTGQPPFVRATLAETLRAAQDDEPPRPGKLNAAVHSDLETICLKCLEKEPAKRYATAQEFADDLDRFLRDEAIHARPVTRAERGWRWCRRKPALAMFAAATALLLLALLIGSPIAAWRINHARKAEQVQRTRAEAESLKARQIAYASDMNLAHQAIKEEDFYRALQLLDRHRPDVKSQIPNPKSEMEQDLRGWEWRYLWRQCQGEQRFILGKHTHGGVAAVGMADKKTVFSAGRDKVVRLWDLESRRQIGVLPHAAALAGAAASPDGHWMATAGQKDAESQPILLWDITTKEIAATLTNKFWLQDSSITFSPDGKWLAFATHFGGVRLYDVNARTEVTNLKASHPSHEPLGLAFSPDSGTLAYNENEGGAIVLWDVTSRSEIGRLPGHRDFVSAIAFSPDGRTLASGSHDRTARLWDLDARRELFSFSNPGGGFTSVAFSPKGRTLAMGGEGASGRVIRLVDVETGKEKARLRGHLGDISSLAFTDEHSLLSASGDGTVRVWDAVPGAKETLFHAFAPNSISSEWQSYGPALCLSPDGYHLLTVYSDQTFSAWDTLRLAEGERHPLPFPNTSSGSTLIAAVAPRGRLAAFGSRSGELMLWDVTAGESLFLARPARNGINRLVFSADGRHLAAANSPKPFSPDGSFIAVPKDSRFVRVWDVGARTETHVFSTEGEASMSLALSADATALMAGFWKGAVKLWHLDGSGRADTFIEHSWPVAGGLALLPDRQTLVSAAEDIRFWDVRTRGEKDKLNLRSGLFSSLALSPDGRRLASGASDGRITIWDTASRQELATLDGHTAPVTQLAFTTDGISLVSAGKDQLRVWRAASPAETEAVKEAGQ